MKLTPTSDNLALATDYLDSFLDGAGCGPKIRIALETVVEEVFMNIVHHSGASVAELTVEKEGDDIVLRFSDDGVPYNPLLRGDPDITLPLEQRAVGGLGILMVRRMTDRQTYSYENGRNLLTLARRSA